MTTADRHGRTAGEASGAGSSWSKTRLPGASCCSEGGRSNRYKAVTCTVRMKRVQWGPEVGDVLFQDDGCGVGVASVGIRSVLTHRSTVFGSIPRALARERVVCPASVIAERKRSLGMGGFVPHPGRRSSIFHRLWKVGGYENLVTCLFASCSASSVALSPKGSSLEGRRSGKEQTGAGVLDRLHGGEGSTVACQRVSGALTACRAGVSCS